MPRMYGLGNKKLSLTSQLDKENESLNRMQRDKEQFGGTEYANASTEFNDGADSSGRDFNTSDKGFQWSPEMQKQFDFQNEMNKYVEGRMNSSLEEDI